jgi:hypothetical protein
MKRFKNNVISKKVSDAIIDAEKLFLPDSLMMNEIINKNDFKFNSGRGNEIFCRIMNYKGIAPVFTYRPKWPWTKALGYSGNGAIHLNVYKLDSLTHADLVGLLCHEYLHEVGFSHGNNFKTKEKILYSVNYYVSEGISSGKWK